MITNRLRQRGIRLALGLAAVAVGLGLLSERWIEEGLGWSPDGGSGTFEAALAVVPLLVGVALLVSARSRRRSRASLPATDNP